MHNPSPIVNKNEVKGFLGGTERKPDRYFYVLWDETVWELDGYCVKLPSGKLTWTILVTCPHCCQVLKLDTERKPLLVDERGLSTSEPIQCSYPGQFGGLCNWRVELEPPKESLRYAVVNGQRVRLDAIAKRA